MLIKSGIWAVVGLVLGLVATAVIRPLQAGGAILIILLGILISAALGGAVSLASKRKAAARDPEER